MLFISIWFKLLKILVQINFSVKLFNFVFIIIKIHILNVYWFVFKTFFIIKLWIKIISECFDRDFKIIKNIYFLLS